MQDTSIHAHRQARHKSPHPSNAPSPNHPTVLIPPRASILSSLGRLAAGLLLESPAAPRHHGEGDIKPEARVHREARPGLLRPRLRGARQKTKQLKSILQDVSGRVERARVLAILGPSGAGKTTLLSLLTLRAPSARRRCYDAGRATADARIVPEAVLLRRPVGGGGRLADFDAARTAHVC